MYNEHPRHGDDPQQLLVPASFRRKLGAVHSPKGGDARDADKPKERGGGYYFNVGCSNLIIDKKVGLIQYGDMDRFVPEGARMRDGSIAPADLIVLATGYLTQQEVARRLLGIERSGRVGRFTESLELITRLWSQDRVSFDGPVSPSRHCNTPC